MIIILSLPDLNAEGDEKVFRGKVDDLTLADTLLPQAMQNAASEVHFEWNGHKRPLKTGGWVNGLSGGTFDYD